MYIRRLLIAVTLGCLLMDVCIQTIPGSHWPHMEFPQVFNVIMEEWLAGAKLKDEIGGGEDIPQPEGDKGEHPVIDEL